MEGFAEWMGSVRQRFSAVLNYEDLELPGIMLLHQVDPTTKLGVLHAEQAADEILYRHPLENSCPADLRY